MCPWPGPSFTEAGKPFGSPISSDTLTDLDAHHWELYHVAEDMAENHDVADQHLDRLIALIAQWYVEAGRYGVLPIDGSAVERLLKDTRLHYCHNYVNRVTYRVSSAEAVTAGRHQLRFEFEPTGPPDFPAGKGTPGHAQLYVDRTLVGDAEFPVTTPVAFNPGGITCGANPGSPVTPD